MPRKRAPPRPTDGAEADVDEVEPLDEAEQEEVIEALRKESDFSNAWWATLLVSMALGLASAFVYFGTLQPSFLGLLPKAQLEANGAATNFLFLFQAVLFVADAAYIAQIVPSIFDRSAVLGPIRPLHGLLPPLGAHALLGSLIPSLYWVLMSVEIIRQRSPMDKTGLLAIWCLALIGPGFAGICHFARFAINAIDAEIVALAKVYSLSSLPSSLDLVSLDASRASTTSKRRESHIDMYTGSLYSLSMALLTGRVRAMQRISSTSVVAPLSP